MNKSEIFAVVFIIVGGILTATHQFNWFVGHNLVPTVYGAVLSGLFLGMSLVDLVQNCIAKKEQI